MLHRRLGQAKEEAAIARRRQDVVERLASVREMNKVWDIEKHDKSREKLNRQREQHGRSCQRSRGLVRQR